MADILSFWLIPTHETRSWLTRDIERLAERYNAPVFEPHLTVHAGPLHGVASPASVLGETAFEFDPITLRAVAIGHSPEFSKAVFLELQQDEALLDLAGKLRERLPSDYVLHPHISLIYQHLSEAQRSEITKDLLVPNQDMRFEVIQAVKCPAVTETADDVRSWQLLEEWRL